MTTTARTAELVIGVKRAQFDAALRNFTPAMQDHLIALGVPYVFSEAYRWLADNKTPESTGVMYVPDAQWSQVLSAMDFLLKELKKPPENLAWLTWWHVAQRMPEGYRQGPTPAVPAPTQLQEQAASTIAQSQLETGTTAAGVNSINIQPEVPVAPGPPVNDTSGVITLPTPTVPQQAAIPAPSNNTLKYVGYAAAGTLGVFLLLKLVK